MVASSSDTQHHQRRPATYTNTTNTGATRVASQGQSDAPALASGGGNSSSNLPPQTPVYGDTRFAATRQLKTPAPPSSSLAPHEGPYHHHGSSNAGYAPSPHGAAAVELSSQRGSPFAHTPAYGSADGGVGGRVEAPAHSLISQTQTTYDDAILAPVRNRRATPAPAGNRRAHPTSRRSLTQSGTKPRPKGARQPVVDKVKDPAGVQCRGVFESFLESFREQVDVSPDYMGDINEPVEPTYIAKLREMIESKRSTLTVSFKHMNEFDPDWAIHVVREIYRFEPYLRRAVHTVAKRHFAMGMQTDLGETENRQFWICIKDYHVRLRLRDLRTNAIGSLKQIQGTVTRVSEVRPELLEAYFFCKDCSTSVGPVVQQYVYTEPTICPNPVCNNQKEWTLEIDRSVFCDWQKIKIQETAAELPGGTMPITFDVMVRQDTVDRVKPGSRATFIGLPIALPEVGAIVKQMPGHKMERVKKNEDGGVSGLKGLGVREMGYKLSFYALGVKTHEQEQKQAQHGANAYLMGLPQEEKEELSEMADNDNIYEDLVESFAPHIYGHTDIKKGLLMQLLGGVHKNTEEGMSLRGDINVLLVGDPATAKSEFLNHVINVLRPYRGVFTSGKSASAVGLTAAVVKDEETGESCIAAGALMLADNGLCAIDEFDKMDWSDQVAIHEAMEQQTISIAKAGVHATLNARASILAAANPRHGRYNPNESLRQNLNLGAALLSRFDLFYVVMDENDEVADQNLALHLLDTHINEAAGVTFTEMEAVKYKPDQIRRYILFAKCFDPKLSLDTYKFLYSEYARLRQRRSGVRVTVRQLESLIRLSEAVARLYLADTVEREHALEALRLFKKCFAYVEGDSGQVNLELDQEVDVSGGSGDGGLAQPMDEDGENEPVRQALDENAMNLDNEDVEPVVVPPPEPKKSVPKTVTLTRGKIQTIQSRIVVHLRELEDEAQESEQQLLDGGGGGVALNDLLDWYIETYADDTVERPVLKTVIKHLRKTSVLLMDESNKTMYIHPDFAFESADPAVL